MVNAFEPRPGCDLPYVESIPHNLVGSCLIPEAPEPIYQSLELPPIPLPPSPGCAVIKTLVEVTRDDDKPADLVIEPEYINDDYCFPLLNFDLNLPCDCAEMKTGEITVDGAEDFLLDKGYSLENIEYMITEEEVCYDQ